MVRKLIAYESKRFNPRTHRYKYFIIGKMKGTGELVQLGVPLEFIRKNKLKIKKVI